MYHLIDFLVIPALIVLGVITVVIGIGLGIALVAAVFTYFYKRISGSRNTDVVLSVTYDNSQTANSSPGISFTLKTKFKSGFRPAGNRLVKVSILPGPDGEITSSVNGQTAVEIKTDPLGDGSFVILGNGDGADVVRIEFNNGANEFPYETSSQ